MDPNETLADIVSLVEAINGSTDADEREADGEQLAWAFQDLDQWLRNGGSLPTAWEA